MFPPWISRSIVRVVIVSSFIFFTYALVFEPKQGLIWLHIISSVKDALGNSKSTQYDANFNVNTYSDALSDTTTYTYSQDGKNNLNSVQDGTFATTKYSYPTSGNSNLYYPLTQTDPQGRQANYTYDSNGNLTSALDNSNSMGLHSSYNPDGTVSKITQDVNSKTQNVTTFGYDSHGNLTTVTPPNTNGSTLKPSTFNVDANTSRVNSVTDGNTHQTTYTYDNVDRIITISYAGGATITSTYDADGNLLSEQDNTGTTTFTYDALNRLRTLSVSDFSICLFRCKVCGKSI